MAALSDAQLKQIADRIFVMRDRATTRLPKPTPTGPGGFKSALDPLATQADFKDAGIGILDFTVDPKNPNVWLHNENKAFRIGSASKIAMMLAAVQLRLDVRRILALNIISTPAEFDDLYKNVKLWNKTKAPRDQVIDIAEPTSVPLISNILDFGKAPVDFFGPDPNGRVKADGTPNLPVQKAIVDKLPPSTLPELPWEKWTDLTFSERYWLAGCLSDNVAATTAVSEIGVPYVKAVQRSYGLFDTARGMHLFASSGYDKIPGTATPPNSPPPRRLTHVQPIRVEDFWRGSSGAFDDQLSWVPGSAAALTAYMIALMTNGLCDDPGGDPAPTALAREGACTTIRNNLADNGPHAIASFLVDGWEDGGHVFHDGVRGVPNTKITRQIDKVGILQRRDGAKSDLVCEFVYLETKQDPPPAAPARSVMRYAVIAVGVISDTARPGDHRVGTVRLVDGRPPRTARPRRGHEGEGQGAQASGLGRARRSPRPVRAAERHGPGRALAVEGAQEARSRRGVVRLARPSAHGAEGSMEPGRALVLGPAFRRRHEAGGHPPRRR